LATRADVEFLINAAAVGVNRAEAYAKFVGDFLEEATFGD